MAEQIFTSKAMKKLHTTDDMEQYKNGLWYSGTQNHTIKWQVPKSLPKGQYKLNYRTYYNKSTTVYAWYYSKKKSTNAWFTIFDPVFCFPVVLPDNCCFPVQLNVLCSL